METLIVNKQYVFHNIKFIYENTGIKSKENIEELKILVNSMRQSNKACVRKIFSFFY
jgi:hypothetical protein